MYRIVVCLDVEASSMKEAYRRVYKKMKVVDCKDFQWESSDEWYDDGTQLDEEDVQRIRMVVFAEETVKVCVASQSSEDRCENGQVEEDKHGDRAAIKCPKCGYTGAVYCRECNAYHCVACDTKVATQLSEGRCEHGMFFSGAGACPECGR